MAARRRPSPLELARILNRWEPRGVSVELTSADRVGLREQLAEHVVDGLRELDVELDVDEAERFYVVATSNLTSTRVADEADEVTT